MIMRSGSIKCKLGYHSVGSVFDFSIIGMIRVFEKCIMVNVFKSEYELSIYPDRVTGFQVVS